MSLFPSVFKEILYERTELCKAMLSIKTINNETIMRTNKTIAVCFRGTCKFSILLKLINKSRTYISRKNPMISLYRDKLDPEDPTDIFTRL